MEQNILLLLSYHYHYKLTHNPVVINVIDEIYILTYFTVIICRSSGDIVFIQNVFFVLRLLEVVEVPLNNFTDIR